MKLYKHVWISYILLAVQEGLALRGISYVGTLQMFVVFPACWQATRPYMINFICSPQTLVYRRNGSESRGCHFLKDSCAWFLDILILYIQGYA